MSADFLVYKYLKMLNLERYEEGNNCVTFRCPICGDSQKSESKKRAGIFGIGTDDPYLNCFNCGVAALETNRFKDFVKYIDYGLYLQYQKEVQMYDVTTFERFEIKKEVSFQTVKKADKTLDIFREHLKNFTQLPWENDVKMYIHDRKIPEKHWDKLFYFRGHPYQLFKDMFDDDRYDVKLSKNYNNQGVLVPFMNCDDKVVGFGIRMYNNNILRFLNLFTIDNKKFFLGENKVDWYRPIIVLEGMLDKLTFEKDDQVLGMLSANPKIDYIKEKAKSDVTYLMDYEFLNNDIYRRTERLIDEGFDVCLWDKEAHNAKDINDLKMKRGWNDKKIFDFIKKNTYNGLEASILLERTRQQLKEELMFR